MINGPKLTPSQWKLLSSALSNISQAAILFSLAAFFVPEAVSLSKDYPKFLSLSFLISGLFMLVGAVIIIKKGK